jgi:2-oxoisovalerate dehydrogenase E1 component beta subunit
MASIRIFRSLLRKPNPLAIPFTRCYSSHPPNARLNVPTDFSTTPLLHHTAASALSNPELPESVREGSKTARLTLHEAINSALRHALASDDSVLLFGEDIAFGGVFRCSANLATDFGAARVFNTPLSEQGIVGFAIGAAAQGLRPVAEIQFADYVYPAFDQLVNEAAKMRYRAGSTGMDCGGLVVRMPCGGVGHGAL